MMGDYLSVTRGAIQVTMTQTPRPDGLATPLMVW